MEDREFQERVNKIRTAIDLVYQAEELVDEALSDLTDHRFVKHYLVYGKYGFNQLLGQGNPYDSSLETLIEEMEKEK